MEIFAFTLRVVVPLASSLHALVERLGAAGCTDAVIGLGAPGCLSLAFERQAVSGYAALVSALADVRRALPDARLVECVFQDAADSTPCAALAP